MSNIIYLDYNATTPCDPRVLEGMVPYFTTHFANPSSVTHLPGKQAADALDTAREQVAAMLGASPKDVLFTSGATESNNLALYGVTRAATAGGNHRRRIITSPIEHKAVLEPCQDLANQGFDVQYVPVDATGLVDLQALADLLTEDTLLVSIQAANSEIGTLQPINQIAKLIKGAGAYFHCDATQAVGRIPIDWRSTPIDLLSLSSHKIYGPKGAGALLARRALRQGQLSPLSRGGGQEGKLRAGTQNVPAIVGFGLACQIMQTEGQQEVNRLRILRDSFEVELSKAVPEVTFNGHHVHRLPNTSSITVPGVDADALLANLPLLALSLGSACNAGAIEPSYVLTEIGLSRDDAAATFRLSLGRYTTPQELESARAEISSVTKKLRPVP
ncbi:cysteine desulfurase family protein [Deinococcus sp.]|uniref:cysteine desulfurase family protein n=1 Tax=Deinococcus sp. TaxID=47478 RepID=UPI0025B9D7C0|nr:cysteine desulfurase family protein [Deinococcus sp.]